VRPQSSFTGVRGATTALVTLVVAVVLGVTAAPVGAAASPGASPAEVSGDGGRRDGSLVLVGGALDDNAEIVREIVRLAGGPSKARIGIVTAGAEPPATPEEGQDPDNNNSVANGLYYSALFSEYGAEATWLPIDVSDELRGNGDSPEVAATAASMTGFFFGGGDQFRYVQTLQHCDPAYTRCSDTRVLAAIRDRLAHGAVVSGVSAGDTIQQGPNMVTGGTSHQGWRDGAVPGYFTDDTLGYLPSGGFGFFPYGHLDSHVGERGRLGRMIRLAMDTRTRFTYGIDETTALVVRGLGGRHPSMSVIGLGGVSVLDLSAARPGSAGGYASVTGVRWTYLRPGDGYDPVAGRALPGRGTRPLAGHESGTGPVPPAADIWSSPDEPTGHPRRMIELGQQLLDTKHAVTAYGVTYETGPRFRVDLVRDRRTDGWAPRTGGRAAVSFDDLEVRVVAA
jgi:cyanophycinase